MIQVVPDTTPQVVYDSSAPEAQNYSEDDPTENASSHLITRAALKWLLTTVALGVAAIIAIAAGVGTWYHREHSHRPSPISRYKLYGNFMSSQLTVLARQTRVPQRRKMTALPLRNNIFSMIRLWQL